MSSIVGTVVANVVANTQEFNKNLNGSGGAADQFSAFTKHIKTKSAEIGGAQSPLVEWVKKLVPEELKDKFNEAKDSYTELKNIFAKSGSGEGGGIGGMIKGFGKVAFALTTAHKIGSELAEVIKKGW